MVDLQVGGVILSGVLIDSRSSCNIIDQKTWEELKQKRVKCKSEKTNQKLYPYGTSEPLDTLGKFEASVNLAGKDVTAEFIVICNEGRPIIGRKTAMELDVLRLGPQVNAVSTPDLVDKYKACFEGVGKLTDYQVKIHVNKEVNPVAQRPRRVPFSLREKVESKVHELEQLDIIEKVKGPTPWVSPLVVVPKPSGVSPAKLLFGREIRSKLPGVEELRSASNDSEVLDRDRERKQKGKDYADRLRGACESNLKEGEKVLLQKPKSDKLSPSFEATPYEVVNKRGGHVEIKSPAGIHYKRNVTHLQKYEEAKSQETAASNPKGRLPKDPSQHYALRPRRNRLPERLKDYDLS